MRLTCNTKYDRHIGSPDSVRKKGESAVILSGKYLLRNSRYCKSASKGHKLELTSFLNNEIQTPCLNGSVFEHLR